MLPGTNPFTGPPFSKEWRPSHEQVLCNRFQVVSDIEHGTQGTVYHVVDESGRRYAAKVGNGARKDRGTHENEVAVFTALQRGGRTPDGFPNIHFVGKHYNVGVICMDLLGHNLYRISLCERFNVRTAFKFAGEMLDRLETLHNHGFIHRDVKPQNFAVDQNGKVYLIDFGMATRYRDPQTDRHLPRRHEGTFCGTMMYASLNAQRQVTQSRRDDLESLGYSIIEMITGGLPWDFEDNCDGFYDHNLEHMAKVKESIMLSKLCEGLPKAIYEYMAQVTTLSYTETPDYIGLRALLKRKMISM